MPYVGPQPKLGRNREVDDISSGFNGSTTAFTLAGKWIKRITWNC